MPSSPVVPLDDPTLLFANAGMNQFKPYFLGTEKPPYKRVANTQKCIRAGGKHNDLDDVGKDTYHHTFFEMLGNWSFGDYFKKEAIALGVGAAHAKSGSSTDAAARHRLRGRPGERHPARRRGGRVLEGGRRRRSRTSTSATRRTTSGRWANTGPCGPCTEIHIDRTPDKSGGRSSTRARDKVIEIWNLVFIQFNRNEDQSLTPLPAKHVDTGMGFERICSVIQGKTSNYDTDVFTPIFDGDPEGDAVREPYTGMLDDLKDTAYRVIADHIRTLTFALTDGATIGNDGRDYVLQRILRRAERYGVQVLGTQGAVPATSSCRRWSSTMGGAFPELKKNPQKVARPDSATKRTASSARSTAASSCSTSIAEQMNAGRAARSVSGEEAFKLHDTYGVLIDITQQMAAGAGPDGGHGRLREGDGGGAGEGPAGREEVRRHRRAGRPAADRRLAQVPHRESSTRRCSAG